MKPAAPPDVAIVLPAHNEAGAAAALVAEIARAFAGERFEIVFVDDASTDDTLAELRRAAETTRELRILRHARRCGQSRAVRTGVLAARAPLIVTLDADGQNDPAEAPALLRTLRGAPDVVAMVAGERRERRDSASRRAASSIANGVRRRLLDDGAADTGCGLKAFRREAFLRLPYFDHMHRYLPALMRREGFEVRFEAVGHRPRASGTSKYDNLSRLRAAFLDLFGVLWLKARCVDPRAIEEVGSSPEKRGRAGGDGGGEGESAIARLEAGR
ncbi:MAG TPA: glycosyltransferase family 2 protein [Caulobacteraceae bacterium]|nr:glycosyltransferase family 2 protein [Caulobacteraceae bacterium]